MKFAFKKHKDQQTRTNNAPASRSTGGDAAVRVGSKWMKVVSARQGEKVTALIRPVEYFSGGVEREFQLAAQDGPLKTENGSARFVHVAMTHTESKPPVTWRKTNKFIDRNVAITDFDLYLCAAGYHYHAAFIAYEAWTIWFDDVNIVDFPLWRGVVEVVRKSRPPEFPESDWGSIKLWVRGLESLEEIEEASRSLLTVPSPEILDHLGAPVRLMKV
jgi:hypothetical protein